MSLFEKIRGEFIDIIEWNDSSTDTMVWRFPRYQDEIKNGAQLIVRPGQMAVFVSEGNIADVFGPGTHQLYTANLPILTSLKSWKYGFESPFKAEVYFTNTKLFTNQKWGTSNPILLQDSELGSVRIKAYGTFVVNIVDSAQMLKQLVGTSAIFTVDDIHAQLRAFVVSNFATLVAQAQIPVVNISAHYSDLGKLLRNQLLSIFTEYGLSIGSVVIENITLPPETLKAIDKKSAINALGNLDQHTQYQAAVAMETAAGNPGGAGSAMGMGVGFGLSGAMASAAQPANSGAAHYDSQQKPPPAPSPAIWWIALNGKRNGPHTLAALRELVAQGIVNAQTPTWRPRLNDWQPAESFSELRHALEQVPPPLP